MSINTDFIATVDRYKWVWRTISAPRTDRHGGRYVRAKAITQVHCRDFQRRTEPRPLPKNRRFYLPLPK
jgi:hypothetical protein